MSSFCANFFVPKKLQSRTIIRENLLKALLYQKFESKILVKLTPRGTEEKKLVKDKRIDEEILEEVESFHI